MIRRKKPPVHVKEATFFKLADIYHAVSTLNEVDYEYYVSGKKIASGTGWVITIGLSPDDSATIVMGKMIYINPRSFDYGEFAEIEGGRVQLRLFADDTELRLISKESEGEAPPIVRRLRKLEEEALELFAGLDDED
jgi:hypothetical protein